MSGDDSSLQQKLLLSINDKVAVIETHVAEIKVDVREHMRRTAILENKTGIMEKLLWMGGGGTAVVYFLLKLAKVI
jgi:hypothetical protein